MNYLASPYSDPDPVVREARYRFVCAATASLLQEGFQVFSPIVQSHPLIAWGLPTEWSFWEPFDRWLLQQCQELWVLQLTGWKQSVGVQKEIEYARAFGIPIRYLQPVGGTFPLTGTEVRP